ncbi:single-stranded DNA-binding protein [Loktanella sp. R86503]|uniref:single-stranded DNA-binding protein n=1 Tax=Loktanella sp. R86503 TaxID=3093847 RepID=UPI0036D938AB
MLNQCQFIGNLGADPEVRTFNNGNKVCNLRIACTEKWKDKNSGEQKEKTEWVSVAIFSEGLAGVAERFLKKGSKVYISGKLATRKWQDQSGADRYSTEIVLQGFDAKLVMLDGANNGGGSDRGGDAGGYGSQGGSGGYGDQSGQNNRRELDDEIPF